jgi:GNAT superfamily N-acetyltransferase
VSVVRAVARERRRIPDWSSPAGYKPLGRLSGDMDYAVLGWPPDGPALSLDHRRFSYAGKFVMTSTGKAVVRDDETPDGAVVAAVAFNADRTDDSTLWLRYLTVRADLRGEGLGARLAQFVASRAGDRGYERVQIAVNNPFAYEAVSKAGFGFTGRETGVAELVMAWPAARDDEQYQQGLDVYRSRDLSDAETDFLAAREGAAAPPVLDGPE